LELRLGTVRVVKLFASLRMRMSPRPMEFQPLWKPLLDPALYFGGRSLARAGVRGKR
jgi:hypothetical protein